MKKILVLILVILILLLSSCYATATGDLSALKGSAGATGEQGIQGPQGPAGGSANVSHKILVADRSLSASSGSVSYTGCGFTPKSIIVYSIRDGTNLFSTGASDDNKFSRCIATNSDGTGNKYSNFIHQCYTGANGQYANVTSYDADGFTLDWTKYGAPGGGTSSIVFLCSN